MPDSHDHQVQQAWKDHQEGRIDEARRAYRELLSRNPQDPVCNNLMGLLCIQSGQAVRAARHIQRALRSDPGNSQSHYNLGIAYKDQERLREASRSFAEAARLDPQNIDYQASLGNALRLSGQHTEAVQVLEKARRKVSGSESIRTNLALAQNDLGAALIRKGEAAQAIRHFLRTVELEPRHAAAHLNLGLTLEQLGRLEEAARHYAAAIAARPDLTDAHFQLAHMRTHQSTDREIDAMKRLLDARGIALQDRVKLAYGLGFALESAGRYAEAFDYMARAHDLQKPESSFDINVAEKHFERIKRVFSTERLSKPEAVGIDDDRPVLIVGMPRSGTTLAEQILASHPAIQGRGESTALARSTSALAGRALYPEGLSRLDKGALLEASKAYLAELCKDVDTARRVTDTTPMNFLLVGLAAMMLPRARFVFCVRDPLDNCLSIYRQMLTGANAYCHTLEDLGAYYRLHASLAEHWVTALEGRVFKLQYEDLVQHNEHQAKALLEFCGLEFDERCLKFYETERVVRSPSAAQVRQPVYTSSIGAWKNYREQLEPLRRALRIEPLEE
jgi:tetratricopeptide (TPR) repeat protein